MEAIPVSRRNPSVLKAGAIALLVLLAVGTLVLFLARVSSPGKISVRCLEIAQRPEGVVLRVAITNMGPSWVFTSSNTYVESSGGHVLFELTGRLPMVRLRPSGGTVTEFHLPDRGRGIFRGQWRIASHFSDNGFRHWLHQPNGLGAKIYPLMPRRLREMPHTVIGKSDTYEPFNLETADERR